MRIAKLVVLMVAVLSFTGCATIVGNTNKNVTFTSEPRGAKVAVESKKPGLYFTTTTPGTIKLSKKKNYFATYSLEGYHTVTCPVDRTVGKNAAGSGVGNLLLIGLLAPIGIGIEAASGASANLPDTIHTDLVPVAEAAPGNAGDTMLWRQKAADGAAHKRKEPVGANAEASKR